MSAVLQATKDRALAYYKLDDTTPFQDYSGYNRAASVVSGTVRAGVGLGNGFGYSTVFSPSARGQFECPVYIQGKESEAFSIEATLRLIRQTEGLEPQPYRENLAINPSSELAAYGVEGSGTGTNAGSTTQKVWGANSTKFVWASLDKGISIATAISGSHIFTLPANQVYTVSFSVFVESGQLPSWVLATTGYQAPTAGTIQSSSLAATGIGSWQRLYVTFNTNAVQSFRMYSLSSAATTYYVDAVMLEKSATSNPYFDGSIAGFEWAGTAHNSVSRSRIDIAEHNLAPNPRITNGTAGPLNNNAYWTGAWNVTLPTPTPDGITTGFSSTVNSASAGSGLMSTYHTDGLGSLPIQRYFGYWVMTPYSGYEVRETIGTTTTYIPLTPNEWQWVQNETNGWAYSLIRKISGNASIGDVAYLTGVTTTLNGPPEKFFDGSSSGATWSGSANSSASIMYASDIPVQILSHTGKNDGLTITNTTVSFGTEYLTTGSAVASYNVHTPQRLHVVGVHTDSKNMLYVNGELVATAEITDEQKADSYIATDGKLYSGGLSGAQTIQMNGVGFYGYALSSTDVLSHYNEVNRNSAHATHTSYRGRTIPLYGYVSDLFLNETFDTTTDWSRGSMVSVAAPSDVLVNSVEGVAGQWSTALSLDTTGATSVYGINVWWEESDVIVEASTDALTWTPVDRFAKLSIIPEGYNPVGKYLYLRVTLPNDDSTLSGLTVRGFKSSSMVSDTQAVSITNPAVPLNTHEPMDMRDDYGLVLNGGTITLPNDTGGVLPKTIEMWVKIKSGGSLPVGGSYAGAAMYTNGELTGTFTNGEWFMFTMTHATGMSNITISGDGTLGRVVYYDQQLTAAQVKQTYLSHIGIASVRIDDTSSISVTEPANAATLYAHEWAIVSSG